MATMQKITDMAGELAIDDLPRLQSLLRSKLTYVPDHVLPTLTINDIILQAPQALKHAGIPADLQLPFFLRNRTYIDRHGGRPIKDHDAQSLDTTRAIFYYSLKEAHQFQRYHDMSRWNMALFTALLAMSTKSKFRSSFKGSRNMPKVEHISISARHLMMTYLAAVMERHNSPAVFDKREEFIRRWKESGWDMFEHLGAAQKKLLKKAMTYLNYMWERELDAALNRMGGTEYDRLVAPMVGSIIPGRKDQGLPATTQTHLHGFQSSASPSPEDMQIDQSDAKEGKNELLEALRIPIGERRKQDYEYVEDRVTPADTRYAITCMQNVTPADMLPVLLDLFSVDGRRTAAEFRAELEMKRGRLDLG
jgi:hypothetical protein